MVTPNALSTIMETLFPITLEAGRTTCQKERAKWFTLQIKLSTKAHGKKASNQVEVKSLIQKAIFYSRD